MPFIIFDQSQNLIWGSKYIRTVVVQLWNLVFIEIKHEIILTYCSNKHFFAFYFRTLIDNLSKSFMMAAYFGPNLSKLCVVSSTTLCTFDMIKKVMMMNSIKNKAFTPAPVMKFCHGIRVVFRWFWLGENKIIVF